jgi:hypothetical protein
VADESPQAAVVVHRQLKVMEELVAVEMVDAAHWSLYPA